MIHEANRLLGIRRRRTVTERKQTTVHSREDGHCPRVLLDKLRVLGAERDGGTNRLVAAAAGQSSELGVI
jgi:hypothetical protein